MSSHQDPYYCSDTGPIYYSESDSERSVTEQLRHPQQPWPVTATTSDHSSYSQPHQSIDPVGNLLEIFGAEVYLCHNFHDTPVYPSAPSNLQDASYSPDHLPTDFSLLDTSFQDSGIETDATYTHDDIPSLSAPSLFSHCLEIDYRRSQNHYDYPPYELVHDYLNQPFVHGAHQMSGSAGSFGVHPAQNNHTPQTSQGPIVPLYPHPSSTQDPLLGFGGPVYQTDTTSARLITDGSTQELIATGRMELPNADNGQHSHPPCVAAASSSQVSTPGPSHPLPGSPERKRSFPSPADDERSETTARRVLPRHSSAQSVRPASSGSNAHSRSNSGIQGRGPLIPQERYTPSSSSSYKKPDQHPITFHLENPDQIGIPVVDLGDSFTRIRDPTQAFSHMGKKTFTLRVQWPGYKPWSKTIAAMDWTNARAPITRLKLAKVVATAIRDLFEKCRDESYDPDYAEWNVGPNGIQLNQICLVAVHRVSTGSWQPELCLLEPRR